MRSAIISLAPFNASATFLTPFSSETYALASSSTGLSVICRRMISASGSSPFSLAIVARVRRFGRYGLYKSSTTTSVWASRICFFSSSVSLPWSSMLFNTWFFLSSRFLRYVSLSKSARSCSSLREPVASFLYREMNGMVLPSSINLTAASTCHFSTFNSCVITWIISINFLSPLVAFQNADACNWPLHPHCFSSIA